MGRKAAERILSMDDFEQAMAGIVATVTKGTLDEAPDAYKNLDCVVERQAGKVIEVLDYVKPFLNIKG